MGDAMDASIAQPGTAAAPEAIVGGGPVGLMLALLLDRHGVASVVFNRDAAVRLQPKGSTHNARTMEHYRRLGLAPTIRDAGLPLDHPTDVAYFTRFNGVELARLRMPSEGEKRRGVADSDEIDPIPEPMLRANQMHVEPLLFDAARKAPNVTLRFGWTVDAIDEAPTGVTLRATRGADGAVEHWRAAFAAGCDGGRSFVRERLGIAYEGYENLRQAFFGGRMVSVHLRAPALYRDFLGRRRAWQYWIVNPEVRTAMVALDGRDEFLLWMQTDGDDDALPDSASISALLGRCAGAPVACDVLAVGRWTAGVALVAERFGSGENSCGRK